jgi:hypothetical protein
VAVVVVQRDIIEIGGVSEEEVHSQLLIKVKNMFL